MNEADFIAALRNLPLHPGANGLNDDAAQLKIGGETLILTHDSMAEGTHFREGADLADVAWKLAACNLSDLAAKGAEPMGALLSYSLGADDARFLEGLREVLDQFAMPLLGGDTIAAKGTRTFGMTAIGRATHTPVPQRSGSHEGDAIYVTGTLGRAMLGFEGSPEHLQAFNRPIPLLAEGRALAPLVTAMMDVSDGLLLDGYRMAAASGRTFEIASGLIPVADLARRNDCVRWGDDYELLFTAPVDIDLPIAATRIGTVGKVESAPLRLDKKAIAAPQDLGFEHRQA